MRCVCGHAASDHREPIYALATGTAAPGCSACACAWLCEVVAVPSHRPPNMNPMAKALSQEERDEIAKLCGEGKSATEIARLTGRSVDTVSRIAKSIGHDFSAQLPQSVQTSLARAHDARSAYCAERRAGIAARLTEETERLLDEMHEPFVAFNFGGKDNTYEEHEFDRPTVDARWTMVRSVREAMRTVLDIDRHDNRGEDLAAVDSWLRDIVGSK